MSSAPLPAERPSVRLAEINVNQAAFDEKIIGVFRFEADTRNKRGPSLILLAEIASSLYVYEQFLDALCDAAERTRQLMTAVDTDPMIRFEKMTQQLNEAVANFVKSEPTPLSWNRINLFALEVSEHGVCLTGIGRMTNLFLQKQVNGSYRSFDLFDSLEQPPEINPQKPFASFICGDFHPGDVFFCGTGNFERLRQELELKERLLAYPPVTAALELKQDLERRRIPDHFSGLIVANIAQPTSSETTSAPVATTPATKQEATRSVQELHEERLETEAYVEPTVSPLSRSGNAMAKAWLNKLSEMKDRLGKRAPKEEFSSARAVHITTPEQDNDDPLTLASLRGMSAGHGATISAKTKQRAVVGVVVVFALLIGGVLIQRARQASAEQALWNAVYTQATDQVTRADGDLVYQNDEGAAALVKQATDLASGLDTKTADRKTAKAKLLQQLDNLHQRLRKELRVDQPTVAYQTNDGTLGSLTVSGKNLVVVNTTATSGTILNVLLNDQLTNSITLPATATAVANIATSKSGVLALTTQKQLALAVLAKKSASLMAFTAPSAQSTAAMSLYNGRLYVIDPTGRMIWRYTGTGFIDEKAYLKVPSDALANAKSIAIDSNVYVGTSNGQILKFLSGDLQTWGNTTIDPAPGVMSALWTSADVDRIVALDATNKRILVLDKNGGLVNQIVSSAFNQPSSLTVDSVAKKIYVSDGQKVLQFELP